MIIGTIRPQEAVVFDGYKGVYSRTDKSGAKLIFEVLWSHGGIVEDGLCEGHETLSPGWYWGNEGEINGPFSRSRFAWEDAVDGGD